MIGRDPWDERCWSGLSRSFFSALKKRDLLHRAFGVEVAAPLRYALIAKNFALPMRRWRRQFNLDPHYYAALTEAIECRLEPADYGRAFLQLGGIYDVPGIVKGRAECFSYHDGNLACMLRSGYLPRMSARRVDAAHAFETRVYEGLDRIFTMSDYLRQSFIDDFEVPGSKVVNIGVGVNWAIPEALDKDYGTQEILFVGIDFRRKGGEHVVRAFRQVRSRYPEARLHVVGPRAVPAILKHPGPGEVFHGFLSRDDATQADAFRRILRQCTLYVMPSLFEPFGVAALEAMVYQMPAILSTGGAFPELVTPGENGELVECGDVADLAAKMIALLGDPESLARQGAAARRRVVDTYTWDKVAERLAAAVDLQAQC